MGAESDRQEIVSERGTMRDDEKRNSSCGFQTHAKIMGLLLFVLLSTAPFNCTVAG